MEDKELIESCQRIFGFFGNGEFDLEEFSLTGFFERLVKEDYHALMEIAEEWASKKFEENGKKYGEKNDAALILSRFYNDIVSIAFAFGYVFGQMFDPHPIFQKDIDVLKKVLKENALSPYFSKEGKAA